MIKAIDNLIPRILTGDSKLIDVILPPTPYWGAFEDPYFLYGTLAINAVYNAGRLYRLGKQDAQIRQRPDYI